MPTFSHPPVILTPYKYFYSITIIHDFAIWKHTNRHQLLTADKSHSVQVKILVNTVNVINMHVLQVRDHQIRYLMEHIQWTTLQNALVKIGQENVVEYEFLFWKALRWNFITQDENRVAELCDT